MVDKQLFGRAALYNLLIHRVPAGCELQIVFDCCHAAAMVQLQYCVGRMLPGHIESASTEKVESKSESESPPPTADKPIPPASRPEVPQHASLYGSPAIDTDVPPPASSEVPAPVVQDPVAAPDPRPSQRTRVRGGVAAPPTAPTQESSPSQVSSSVGTATSFVASLFGRSSTSATPPATTTRLTTSADVRHRGRNLVVQGGDQADHFEERQEGFVRSAGKVVVWAATGENQLAFEASRGSNGILINALCSAFDTCVDRTLTCRDLWHCISGAIDSENADRKGRDAKKSADKRPDPAKRIQHAELWVSQGEQPLDSAESILSSPLIERKERVFDVVVET